MTSLSLRDYKDRCDLCGLEADSEVAEVVGLDCSFAQCPSDSLLYHQACLEKYLKSIRCERNRKVGFPCPRGCGKGTVFPDKCKGKIAKSHIVTVRSEGNKKRRQAELEVLQRTASHDAESVGKGKAAKRGDTTLPMTKDKKATSLPAPSAAVKIKVATKAPAIRALNVANTSISKSSLPKSASQVQRDHAKEMAAKLKAELEAKKSGTLPARTASKSMPSGPSSHHKEVKTLEEYLAERSASAASKTHPSSRQDRPASNASSSVPTTNPWARGTTAASRSSSHSSTSGRQVASGPSEYHQQQQQQHPERHSTEDLPRSHSSARDAFHVRSDVPTTAAQALPPPPRSAWAAPPPQQPAVIRCGTEDDDAAGAAQMSQSVASNAATAADGDPDGTCSSQRSASPEGNHHTIPGLEATSTSTEPAASKLTKAQRKNLKRAEKKAAARLEDSAVETASVTSGAGSVGIMSGVASSMVSDGDYYMGAEGFHLALVADEPDRLPDGEELMGDDHEEVVISTCLAAVVQHKLQSQVAQLMTLGFPSEVAIGAVVRCAGNLVEAVTLLLSPGGEGEARRWLGESPETAVDVTKELAVIRELQRRHGFSDGAMETLVMDCFGDMGAVTAAVAAMFPEQYGMEDTRQESVGTPVRSVDAARPGARVDALHGDAGTMDHNVATPAAGGEQRQRQQQGSLFSSLDSSQTGGFSIWGALDAPSANATTPDIGGSRPFSLFGSSGLAEAALDAVHGSGSSAYVNSDMHQQYNPQQQQQQRLAHDGYGLSNGGQRQPASLFADFLPLGISPTDPHSFASAPSQSQPLSPVHSHQQQTQQQQQLQLPNNPVAALWGSTLLPSATKDVGGIVPGTNAGIGSLDFLYESRHQRQHQTMMQHHGDVNNLNIPSSWDVGHQQQHQQNFYTGNSGNDSGKWTPLGNGSLEGLSPTTTNLGFGSAGVVGAPNAGNGFQETDLNDLMAGLMCR